VLLEWYLHNVYADCRQVSFANLWVNNHYFQSQAFFEALLSDRSPLAKRIVLIANHAGITRLKQGLVSSDWPAIIETYSLPDQIVRVWETAQRDRILRETVTLAQRFEGVTFLLSGGPAAKVIAYRSWKANPNNQYVEIGSILDEPLKGYKTRPYADQTTKYFKERDWSWFIKSAEPNDHTPIQACGLADNCYWGRCGPGVGDHIHIKLKPNLP
jgi:hypothetical protein